MIEVNQIYRSDYSDILYFIKYISANNVILSTLDFSHEFILSLERFKKGYILQDKKYKCNKCGNEDNLHLNYDYSKTHRPILDILCNECGNFFDPQAI